MKRAWNDSASARTKLLSASNVAIDLRLIATVHA
jgi:hypothetical protein